METKVKTCGLPYLLNFEPHPKGYVGQTSPGRRGLRGGRAAAERADGRAPVAPPGLGVRGLRWKGQNGVYVSGFGCWVPWFGGLLFVRLCSALLPFLLGGGSP